MIAGTDDDAGESCRPNGQVEQHLPIVPFTESRLFQYHVTMITNNYCRDISTEHSAPLEKWCVEKIRDRSFLGFLDRQIEGIPL